MTDPSETAAPPPSLSVTVNGSVRAVPAGCSVGELVRLLGFAGAPVAVERNGEVVPRRTHEGVLLCEGDVVEVVTFVGGG